MDIVEVAKRSGIPASTLRFYEEKGLMPFALPLFSIGAGLVVLGGLAFNLIPFCREGVPLNKLMKVALIVLIILGLAVLLGIGTAYLYAWYLKFMRG
jgi:hypothetical protein